MSKALYRKYRSKGFDEVVGQEHITDTLKNAIKTGKLSHAYLFTGPRGVGKTSIARILAHEINELPYSDESTHLDIIEIDAASNRRIDEIRELRDKVHVAPTSGKYKVYIIDEVHMLTREAFNALLKTLEEPPAHVVFILATTEAHKVPETIVSRTQRFTFKAIGAEDAINHLRAIAKKEKIIIDDEALELIAEHGRGSFRDSISILDQLAGFKEGTITLEDVRLLLGLPDDSLLDACLEAVNQHSVEGVFGAVQKLREQGIDSGRAAKSLSERLRNQIATNNTADGSIIRTLRELLELTTTTQDYLGIELALLSGFTTNSTPRPTNQAIQPTKTRSTPQKQSIDSTKKPTEATLKTEDTVDPIIEKAEAPMAETAPETEQKVASLEVHVLNSDTWNELLHAIKQKHNTLYGVLRMAEASQDTEGIVLSFGFGFHKKQIDTPKNSAIIREFLQKHFGTSIVKTVVVKNNNRKKAPEVKQTSAPDPSVISSVSNIFGGAELLES